MSERSLELVALIVTVLLLTAVLACSGLILVLRNNRSAAGVVPEVPGVDMIAPKPAREAFNPSTSPDSPAP